MTLRTPALATCILLSSILGLAAPVHAAQLAISWTDNAADEDGFTIERRPASGAFQQIATLGANVVGYLDSTVPAGATYCYRVRAFNVAGVSAFTNEGCGTAAASATLPLTVTLNQATFRRSETMVATVHATSGVVTTQVDAYVVVQAGGAFLSLQLDGRLVPGLVPIARNILLPTVDAPFSFPLGGAPPGNYTWMAGVTSPGGLTLVAPIASTNFTITP